MKKYIFGLFAILLLTAIFGSMYILIQQSMRADANDPQISIAQDTAAQLDNEVLPRNVVGTQPKIDLATSLDTFIVIYEKDGSAVAGTGYLDGTLPTIPNGVLKSSDSDRYHAVTWEPKSGVRIAAVVVQSEKYYVLSGRSLSEVEGRTNRLAELTLAGWLISLFITGLGSSLYALAASRSKD